MHRNSFSMLVLLYNVLFLPQSLSNHHSNWSFPLTTLYTHLLSPLCCPSFHNSSLYNRCFLYLLKQNKTKIPQWNLVIWAAREQGVNPETNHMWGHHFDGRGDELSLYCSRYVTFNLFCPSMSATMALETSLITLKHILDLPFFCLV